MDIQKSMVCNDEAIYECVHSVHLIKNLNSI